MSFGVQLILGIIFAVVYIYYVNKGNEKRQTELMNKRNREKELEKYAKMEFNLLKVTSCTSEWISELKIQNETNVTLSYVPKKYIYTSATVGGITTGGVDTVGGYNNVSKGYNSGKCKLTYFDKEIESIQLPDSLYQIALGAPIHEYLNDKKQIAVVEGQKMGNIMIELRRKGYDIHTANGFAMYQEARNQCLPTYEKCVQIIDFLNSLVNLQYSTGTSAYVCPTCGCPIAFKATKCDSCGQDIVWQ